MAASRKIVAIVISLSILLGVSIFGLAYSTGQLELLASSDFIPEVRAAASRALTKRYVAQEVPLEELKNIAIEARTEDLREAAVDALVKKFENVKEVSSLEEVKSKTKELEKQASAGDSPELQEAASTALGLFYLAFNLNNQKGYSKDDLEKTVKSDRHENIKSAAADALGSIYPNYLSAEELKELILNSEYDLIKRAGAMALTIRYSTQLSPDISLQELMDIASDKTVNPWVRQAAGDAYGRLAQGKVGCDRLKEITTDGATEAIREGASNAWSRCLIKSDRTKTELLRMACAATSFAPVEYSDAVIYALADRMSDKKAPRGDK